MIADRHDSLALKLNPRPERESWRLWIEDTRFARLKRNNFEHRTPFTLKRRPGVGLILRQDVSSRFHVSRRRGAEVLSYESKDLAEMFPTPEIRVRIHVGMIVVAPRVRFTHIAREAEEEWRITGTAVHTPSAMHELRRQKPLFLRQRAGVIVAELTESNLILATELIGNQRPGVVRISGPHVPMVVASQFLRAIGYGDGEVAGEFRR